MAWSRHKNCLLIICRSTISSSIALRMLRTLFAFYCIIICRDAYAGAPTSKHQSKLKKRGTILPSSGNNLISSAPLLAVVPALAYCLQRSTPTLPVTLYPAFDDPFRSRRHFWLWLICLQRSILTLPTTFSPVFDELLRSTRCSCHLDIIKTHYLRLLWCD